MTVWVAQEPWGSYVVCVQKPTRLKSASSWVGWTCPVTAWIFGPAVWERMSPFRLKPGEGPIRVDLKVIVTPVARRAGGRRRG